MKKEFIPYEQALALKELGFDEPCFGFYNNADGNVWIKHTVDESIKSIYIGDFEAPTFSQCFRWFREKHSLQCLPMQDRIDVWWCLFSKDVLSSGYLLKNGDYGHYLDEHLEFKTYEEAELECLKKLIEIVKTK